LYVPSFHEADRGARLALAEQVPEGAEVGAEEVGAFEGAEVGTEEVGADEGADVGADVDELHDTHKTRAT